MFDTAVAARVQAASRLFPWRFLCSLAMPRCRGKRAFWCLEPAVLLRRRPGQDKNRESLENHRTQERGTGLGLARSMLRVQLGEFERRFSAGDERMALGRFGSVVVLAGCMLGGSVTTGLSAMIRLTTSTGAALRQPQIRSRQCQGRSIKTMMWPGFTPDPACRLRSPPNFENWRRVRDSEGAEGWVYHSLAVGPSYRCRHHEEWRPTLPRSTIARQAVVAARLQAGVSRPGRAPTAGAVSRATALTAGSNSSGCGGFTPTRRWNRRHAGPYMRAHEGELGRRRRPQNQEPY